MAQISYSFCMSMLHSLWQAGILLLLYFIANKFLFVKAAPLAKRNFLFLMLATQILLAVSTFLIFFSAGEDHFNPGVFAQAAINLFPPNIILSITPFLFIAYNTIVAYRLLKAFYSWYRFRQLYKPGLQKPGIDLKLFTELKAYQFGIKRKVRLWLSQNISTPVTFGFFRPVILLPVSLVANITMQQAETLILHELTHIRWNDYLLNWFLVVVENIFFFNPFIAAICKNIRTERELNCDMSVIAFEYAPALYASTLLQAERMKQSLPGFQLAAVSRKKQLLQRIRFFTDEKNGDKRKPINFSIPLLGLVLLLSSYGVSLFKPAPTSITEEKYAPVTAVYPSANRTGYAPFENNILAKFRTKDISAIVPGKDRLKNIIEKNSKKMNPASRAVDNKPDLTATNMVPDFVVPIAEKTNDGDRQIIINEESSGSKSLTVKVYWLRFRNGQWVIEPGWMASAKQFDSRDTISKIHDSSSRNRTKAFPAQ